MIGPPKVSVYIAVYNYERFVCEAIDSILDQSLRDIECIAIDDRSTDNTWQVLQRYRDDPRIRLIRHDVNLGHLGAYATGLASSRGRYVVNLNADDKAIDRDALRSQAERLDSDERLGVVFSDYDVIDDRSRTVGHRRIPWPDRLTGARAFRLILFDNLIMHSGTMVRRSCLEELGSYDHRFPHSGDRELWIRISTRYDLAHIRRPLWAYRMHSRNMSRAFEDSPPQTIAFIDTVLSYAPFADERLRDRLIARDFVARAEMWLRAGDVGPALRELRSAIRLHPPALLNIGLARGAVRGALSRFRGGPAYLRGGARRHADLDSR